MLLGIIACIVFIVGVIANPLWKKTSQKKTTKDEASNIDTEDYQSFIEEQTEDPNKETDGTSVSESEDNNELKNENFQSSADETTEETGKNGTGEDAVPDSEEPEEPPLQVEEPKDEGYGPLL